jgi:hypothetical protein
MIRWGRGGGLWLWELEGVVDAVDKTVINPLRGRHPWFDARMLSCVSMV